MGTDMKKILLSLIIFLSFVIPSFAADWYVRKGAAGANSGADWTNAWNEMNQIAWGSISAGDTIWLAGGTYTTQLSIGASGTSGSRIYVRRVKNTDTVPIAAAGWNAAYDAQVVISAYQSIYFSGTSGLGSYVTIDGREDFGIKLVYPDTGWSAAGVWLGTSSTHKPVGVILQYLDVAGPSSTGSYPRVFEQGVVGIHVRYAEDLTIRYCRVHDDTGGIFMVNVYGNIVVEHNKIYRVKVAYDAELDAIDGVSAGSYQLWHEEFSTIRSCFGKVTYRYNEMYEGAAEGIFLTHVGGETSCPDGVEIYGNLMHSPYDGASTTLRFVETQTSPWLVKIYNNTVVDCPLGIRTSRGGDLIEGSEIRNNLLVNSGGISVTGTYTASNNLSTSDTTYFVSYSGDNYHLAKPTATRGYTLASPYNTDMDGYTRGADGYWDIGAYEGGGTVEDNVAPTFPGPNTPSGTIACDASSPVDVTFTIGTNENATCTYSATDVAYASATVMSSTGGTTHTQTVALACDASYTYYFKCRDTSPAQNTNTSSNDLALSFTVQAGATEAEVPVMSNPLPVTGSRFACTANPLAVTLGITATDESGVTGCQYALTDIAYGAEGGVALDTTGGTPIEDVDSYYASSNYSTAGLFIGYGAATTLSQSFESNGGTLNTAQFYLRKYAGATGNIVATLYAGDGTIGGGDDVGTGEILATSDAVDISTLSSSAMQLTTFTFSGANRVTLTDGNHYVIGVYYTGVASTQVLYAGSDNTSPSHTGNTCYEDGGWTALSGYDLVFYVNVMRGGSGDYSKSVNFACGASYNVYYRCTDGTHPNTTPSSTTFTVYSATPENATEAESDTETSPMMAVEDIQASGGYYVASTTANSGSTTLTINVATAGTYRIGARVFASGSGTDSMFVTVNEEDECVWHFNPTESSQYYNAWYNDYVNCQGTGTFTAPQYDPYVVTLTSGDNTFTFRGREAGSRLDYVWLEPYDMPVNPVVPSAGTTRFMVGVGQTMTISPTTGGCTVVIE